MATVKPTITQVGENALHFKWTLTQADAVGHPIPAKYSDFRDRSVHVSGTFDSATVVWQGSNLDDAATFVSLTDPQGNAISKTAEGLEQVMEATLFQRPSSSGGGGTQAVVVSCLCVRNPLPRG